MTTAWPRLLVGGSLFAAFSALAAAGPFGAPRIAGDLQRTAQHELQKAGMSWARADSAGRVISLSGTAPNGQEKFMAEAAVRSIGGVIRVESGGIAVAEPAVELLNIDDELTAGLPLAPTAIIPAAQETQSVAECQTLIEQTLDGRRLVFRHQSSRLGNQDRNLLGELISSLSGCADVTLVIEAHTDSTGSSRFNLALSERRARVVKETLGELDPSLNVVVRAYGELRPVAANQTPEGRSANRRIDFIVTETAPESD